MEKKFLRLLIKVSQKIAIAKTKLAVMADKHPIEYMELRDSLNDIVDEMAKFCECRPTDLIFGKLENLPEKSLR